MRAPLLACALLTLSACATSGGAHDWSGENAEPFDGALAACERESNALPKPERTAALDSCMARRGWHRR